MPSDPETFAKLFRRWRALPEMAMRRAAILETWGRLDADSILALIEALLARVARRESQAFPLLDALNAALLAIGQNGFLYERIAEVYRLAHESGRDAVTLLLSSAHPKLGPLQARDLPRERFLGQRSLGERKWMARGWDRTSLTRLLLDSDPAVIRHLLRNPRLTEADVVYLAARRPTLAELQREIFESPFGQRLRVRVALVRNPFTPPELSLKLLPFLLRPDLKEVSRDGRLHERLRMEAERWLQEEPPRG